MSEFGPREVDPTVAVSSFVTGILQEANLLEAARYSELPFEIDYVREQEGEVDTAINIMANGHVVIHSAPYLTGLRDYVVTPEGLAVHNFRQSTLCEPGEVRKFVNTLSVRSAENERFSITFRKGAE